MEILSFFFKAYLCQLTHYLTHSLISSFIYRLIQQINDYSGTGPNIGLCSCEVFNVVLDKDNQLATATNITVQTTRSAVKARGKVSIKACVLYQPN